LTGGASVTSAAHQAGFSDGAHLTRTFRRMLGLRPSDCVMRARLTVGLEPTMDNHTAKSDKAARINAARQFGADEIRVVSSTRLNGASGPLTISGERSLTPID